MPTPRAAAAFRFLTGSEPVIVDGKKVGTQYTSWYYYKFLQEQWSRIDKNISLNISSYDLSILQNGIECAMYPHLYPTSKFTDTGIMETYRDATGDKTNRVVSIGQSWTRKVLSEVRLYGEHRDPAFFLFRGSDPRQGSRRHGRCDGS